MKILLDKVLHWRMADKEPENDSLIFQFCHFDNSSIVNINIPEVNFIGCLFDGGYISDSKIGTLNFIGCSMIHKHKHLDLSLGNIGQVNQKYSDIKYLDNNFLINENVNNEYRTNISCIAGGDVYKADDFLENFESYIQLYNNYNLLIIIGTGLLNIDFSVRSKVLKFLIKYYMFLNFDYKDWIMEGILSQSGNLEVFPNYKEIINGLKPEKFLFKASFDRLFSLNANSIIEALQSIKAGIKYSYELKDLVDIDKVIELRRHYVAKVSELSNDILELIKQ